MSNFNFFHNVFYAICIKNPLIATFQLSSAASLNLGLSQNGVLGNGLTNKKHLDLLNLKVFECGHQVWLQLMMGFTSDLFKTLWKEEKY